MPRLKRSDKRKHEVTLEVLNVLANMRCYGGEAARADWERFWGGPDEGRAAFEDLRHVTRGTNSTRVLGVKDGETYEQWLERLAERTVHGTDGKPLTEAIGERLSDDDDSDEDHPDSR
jgi:hypothetical protein